MPSVIFNSYNENLTTGVFNDNYKIEILNVKRVRYDNVYGNSGMKRNGVLQNM